SLSRGHLPCSRSSAPPRSLPAALDLLFLCFSSRRRHTRSKRDWSSDVCSSDLFTEGKAANYKLCIMGSALLYFIIPVDVIPDYVFPMGYIDDALAVKIALKMLSS